MYQQDIQVDLQSRQMVVMAVMRMMILSIIVVLAPVGAAVEVLYISMDLYLELQPRWLEVLQELISMLRVVALQPLHQQELMGQSSPLILTALLLILLIIANCYCQCD